MDSVRLCSLIGELPRPPSGFVGFTTYLRLNLMRGVPFRPAVRRPSDRQRSHRGLVLGRRLDSAFRVYATEGRVNSLTSSVASVLRRRGIRMTSSQAVVFHPGIGVKTAVDGIGYDSSGTVWVIELKNTQSSLVEHDRSYSLPCPGNGFLSNGHRNSERVRHQLQAGFGVLCLRRCFPSSVVIRGLVIVNCSDGARGYGVDLSTYGVYSAFPRGGGGSGGIVDGGSWDSRDIEVRRLIHEFGFISERCRRVQSGTVGVYRDKNGNRRLAVGSGEKSAFRVRRCSADVRAIIVPCRSGLRLKQI